MSELAAPSSPPRRRFVPEPIEVSRSSKRHQQGKPVTEHAEDSQEKPMQRDREPEILITPETPTNNVPRRRFAPEPVETSARSSKKKVAPEPVESSARSSKDRRPPGKSDDKPLPRRKFVPEPVETTSTFTRRRRKVPEPEEEDDEKRDQSHADRDLSRSSSNTSTGSRKFKPEVVEVARASYRRGRSSSEQSSPKDQQLPSPPDSPESSKSELAEPQESRFSAAALAKRHHPERKHSFQVPELAIIESESSDEKDTPTLSDVSSSASDIERSPVKGPKYHAIDRKPNKLHETVAKAVDKDLTNQMLAAYINERPYEPVAHFAYDDEGDTGGKLSGINGIDVKTFRRDSGTEHDWEVKNMQRHHAQLEQMKQDLKKDTAGQSRFSAAALIARHHGIEKREKKKTHDNELKKMRSAASPPMLGDDLWFPQSISPKMTRCDVDQIPRPRTNEEHDYEEVEGDPMLWQTTSNVSAHSGVGLWGGLCQKTGRITRPPTPMRSGLQTPAAEVGNPFESPRTRTPGTKTPSRKHRSNFSGSHFQPLSPPNSLLGEDTFTASIDKKLNMEREFDEQFPTHVITQIYNYISLGYPVLAHVFDEELSKISRIPVHELRKDDNNADANGHVGVPEGAGVDEEAVSGGKCKRWEALRLYCKEWYRQSPQMVEKGPEDWGSNNRIRRGSWNR